MTACGTEVPLGHPELSEQDVLARAERLRSHQTTRADVRTVLGTPRITSERGGVDLFRLEDTQHQLLLFFAPYPIPLPSPGVKIEGYTLVAYDEGGNVAAVDAGFTQAEIVGGTHHLILRAGDHEFMHGQKDALSVAPDRFVRDRAASAHESTCTLIIGCEKKCDVEDPTGRECGVCWTRVEVDGGPVRELPLIQALYWPLATRAETPADTPAARNTEASCLASGGHPISGSCFVIRRSLHPLTLAAGRHTLRFTTRLLDGEVVSELACGPGDLVFAALEGELRERYSMSRQFTRRLKTGLAAGSVTFSPDAPAALLGQRVLVNVDGGWLLPAYTP